MKLLGLLLFVGLMQLHATTFGQTDMLSIKTKQMTVDQVFDAITKQLKYDIFYSNDEIDVSRKVEFSESTISIVNILNRILGDDFNYRFIGKTIVIQPKMAQQDQRQSIRISGRVTDAQGEPLPGVTVLIKGTHLGVTTNMEGRYTLSLLESKEEHVLLFTMVGMKPEEIKYTGQASIDVVMKEDTQELEGVVITGMFTRRAESFTGAATTFKKDDILRVGNQNLIRSLKNLDPAFQIMEDLEFGSDPNRLPNVQLRGQTSFPSIQGEYEGNPNQPLFILDGFETTLQKVYDLDMNRIASVTLLKDAAAKAIYGSKAGNGVVVIETIRPQTGELRIYYSGDFGIEAPDLTGYDLMNASEKLAHEVQMGMYGHSSGNITAYNSYKRVYDDVLRGVDTYWLSKPLHTGFSHKHSLNLEGGDERMRYQLGVSYNKVTGVMKGSDRNTLNVNTTLAYTYKNLLFRNTIEFTRNWAENSPYGSFSEYASMNPYWAPYDEDGNLVKTFFAHFGASDSGLYDNEVYNPLYNATLNTKNHSMYTEIRDNFSVDWRLNEAFRAVGSFSYTRQESGSDVFYPASHTRFIHYDENGMSDRKGQYTKGDGSAESVSMQAGINFNKMFGQHLIFANLLWNMATSNSTLTTTVAEGFGNDYMDDISFATKYLKDGKPTGNNGKTREVGLIGALNYSFADRYLFDASLRKSASSVYGSDNRWGTFWSLGIGWNIHHERFLEGNTWLKQFKLRASMGYTGTQNISPSQSRARYEYYDYAYSDKIGAQLVALPNDKLKWQRNMDYNIGLDMTIKRFLNLRAEYYIQRTDDLLSNVSLPPSTGFLNYTENLGKIENRGYELALSVTPWRNDRQRAYVTVSVSAMHNKNKIKKIYDIFKNSNEDQSAGMDDTWLTGGMNTPEVIQQYLAKYTKPATLYYEGCSMTAIWGVQSLGIDPASGQEMFLTKDGSSTYTWSSADQIVVGDESPKLRGNIGLSAGYKGFTLSVACSYRFGGDLYNSNLIARMENVSGLNNLDRRIVKAWQKTGDIAPYRVTIARPNNGGGENMYTRPTSRFVQENNELYISSVNMGYDFSGDWLKKLALQRLKLSFYMNELVRMSSIEIERGTAYPFARNFSFSLQATF